MNKPLWERFFEVAQDAPIVGTPTLLFLGIPLGNLIVGATALWAVARVIEIGLSIYWKVKDRREQSKRG